MTWRYYWMMGLLAAMFLCTCLSTVTAPKDSPAPSDTTDVDTCTAPACYPDKPPPKP